ncbi:MAG: hypothetical protein NVSMB14_03350 [Isosphaeraceae bacterium]
MGPIVDRRTLGKLGLASFAGLLGAKKFARSEDAGAVHGGGARMLGARTVPPKGGSTLENEGPAEDRDDPNGAALRLVGKVEFTSDGTRFFASDDAGGVTLRDAKTGKIVREYELPIGVEAVPISRTPDGFLLAASHPRGPGFPKNALPANFPQHAYRIGAVDVREVDSGRLAYQLTHEEDPAPHVAIGQKYVMTLGREVMRVWGRADGKELYKVSLISLTGPGMPWRYDPLYGPGKPWRYDPQYHGQYPRDRRPDGEFDRAELPYVALAPDGQRAMKHVIMRIPKGISSVLGSVFQCWDGTNRKFYQHVLDSQLYHLAIRPDGREFASFLAKGPAKYGDAPVREIEIQIRKFEDGAIVKTIPFTGPTPYFLAYSVDGKRLITATRVGGVSVWDIDKGTLLQSSQGPNKAVRAVFLLPAKGVRVVAGWHEADPSIDERRERELKRLEKYQPLEIWER